MNCIDNLINLCYNLCCNMNRKDASKIDGGTVYAMADTNAR